MTSSRTVLAFGMAAMLAACSAVKPRDPPPRPVADAASLAGAWLLTVESPVGAGNSDAVFTQAGDRLDGRITSFGSDMPLTGTLNGAAVSFGGKVNVLGRDVPIDYTGTVSGDTMGGTVQFGPYGQGKWTGKRKR